MCVCVCVCCSVCCSVFVCVCVCVCMCLCDRMTSVLHYDVRLVSRCLPVMCQLCVRLVSLMSHPDAPVYRLMFLLSDCYVSVYYYCYCSCRHHYYLLLIDLSQCWLYIVALSVVLTVIYGQVVKPSKIK